MICNSAHCSCYNLCLEPHVSQCTVVCAVLSEQKIVGLIDDNPQRLTLSTHHHVQRHFLPIWSQAFSGTVRKFSHLPKYGHAWGRGVLNLPVSKKCKNEKKTKKKKETKNANSIDMMFDWSFHLVSRTEDEIYAWCVLTRLCLAGGVSVAASKGALRRRQEHPSERIKPRRQGTYLSCPMRSTLISPGDFLFLFQCFWRCKFVVRP